MAISVPAVRGEPLKAPLIIGAGPAGTAAAICLARAGHAPLLLERAEQPGDKVCGDFVGVDAIALLAGLGVEPAHLGAAPIHRLRLVHRGRITETALPFTAFGLSRRSLDGALSQRATQAGASLRMGSSVRRLSRNDAGWQADTASERIDAVTVFLATGKHDLRDHPRTGTHPGDGPGKPPRTRNGAVGLKMYLRLTEPERAALAGAIELFLFPGLYAGLQCIEEGKAVLCLALKHGMLQAYGGTWDTLIAAMTDETPLLRQRLRGATPMLPRPLAIAGIPYGHLRRSASDPGLYRLGDQTAVIPSLTGDGIAIALHSGALAAMCWLQGLDADAYHRRLAADLGRQMQLANALQRLATTGPLQATAHHITRLFPSLLRWSAAGTRLSRPEPLAPGSATRGLHPA